MWGGLTAAARHSRACMCLHVLACARLTPPLGCPAPTLPLGCLHQPSHIPPSPPCCRSPHAGGHDLQRRHHPCCVRRLCSRYVGDRGTRPAVSDLTEPPAKAWPLLCMPPNPTRVVVEGCASPRPFPPSLCPPAPPLPRTQARCCLGTRASAPPRLPPSCRRSPSSTAAPAATRRTWRLCLWRGLAAAPGAPRRRTCPARPECAAPRCRHATLVLRAQQVH